MKRVQSIKNNGDRTNAPAPSPYATNEQRWLALQQRDAGADGHFVYSVATTGVYCRPNCPSRLALRRHIAFYPSCAAAESAGFRPCKRCHPVGPSQPQQHAAAAARACRFIESSLSVPALDKLAAVAGLSPFHFHRIFKKAIGLTPRQYAAAHRARRLRSELRTGQSVTEAIYGAGFNSNSRFYERSAETLGMTPRQYQNGGQDVLIRYAIALCPLGLVLVAGTVRGICAVSFGEDRAALERHLKQTFPQASIDKGDSTFNSWVKAVVELIRNPARTIDLPLDIRGTAFQHRVWQALREIPSGQTMTYAQVAASIGQPAAVRAVASACANNRLALLIPCHRVIGTNGKLTGYRWGLKRKRQLLKREQKS